MNSTLRRSHSNASSSPRSPLSPASPSAAQPPRDSAARRNSGISPHSSTTHPSPRLGGRSLGGAAASSSPGSGGAPGGARRRRRRSFHQEAGSARRPPFGGQASTTPPTPSPLEMRWGGAGAEDGGGGPGSFEEVASFLEREGGGGGKSRRLDQGGGGGKGEGGLDEAMGELRVAGNSNLKKLSRKEYRSLRNTFELGFLEGGGLDEDDLSPGGGGSDKFTSNLDTIIGSPASTDSRSLFGGAPPRRARDANLPKGAGGRSPLVSRAGGSDELGSSDDERPSVASPDQQFFGAMENDGDLEGSAFGWSNK
ncbi:hypothetical protein TeGR_g12614 [Tetraparma gracilis]|uniref:Uncharacterized protein n=1 Tax=Tetraparma gracilis TaxID=2962635 RepID=A0ABQ6MET6_9STRA|nr:hypothetical protein TeGR_g12614 [Tetraparma gracilis]